MDYGVYGLVLEGLDAPEEVLLPAAPGWPTMAVERTGPDPGRRRPAGLDLGELHFDDEHGEMWISDTDFVEVDRTPLRVRFATSMPLSDDLVAHPYIALPAAVANRWYGRQLLHGGGVVLGDRVWALLGTKESGKSSTLAALHAAGHAILSDDILAFEDGYVYAGPRTIDLREPAARRLGGEHLEVGAGRERYRLRPGPTAAAVPLAGLVHLEWGDAVSIEPIPPVERLLLLIANNVFGTGVADAAVHLDLAALPTWRFVRPQDLERLDGSIDQLVSALA